MICIQIALLTLSAFVCEIPENKRKLKPRSFPIPAKVPVPLEALVEAGQQFSGFGLQICSTLVVVDDHIHMYVVILCLARTRDGMTIPVITSLMRGKKPE
jgi:hypothetical protein